MRARARVCVYVRARFGTCVTHHPSMRHIVRPLYNKGLFSIRTGGGGEPSNRERLSTVVYIRKKKFGGNQGVDSMQGKKRKTPPWTISGLFLHEISTTQSGTSMGDSGV